MLAVVRTNRSGTSQRRVSSGEEPQMGRGATPFYRRKTCRSEKLILKNERCPIAAAISGVSRFSHENQFLNLETPAALFKLCLDCVKIEAKFDIFLRKRIVASDF